MVDLRVTLGRLTLENPVLVASGTFGYVREMAGFVRLERLGGVIPKTVTFRPRAGNPTPRTVETASGMLNAIGLDNDGIAHFRTHHLPYLRTVGTAVIANIAGEDEDQFVADGRDARRRSLVLRPSSSISPVPTSATASTWASTPKAVGRLVRRVRAACPLPIIAKLTPNVTDIVPIAAAAAEAGADAVSLINTLKGMAVDWRRRRPILANDIGGLERSCHQADRPPSGLGSRAGPPRLSHHRHRRTSPRPVDALEFLVAGASAIQVGTATFYHPPASESLLDELTRLLEEREWRRLERSSARCGRTGHEPAGLLPASGTAHAAPLEKRREKWPCTEMTRREKGPVSNHSCRQHGIVPLQVRDKPVQELDAPSVKAWEPPQPAIHPVPEPLRGGRDEEPDNDRTEKNDDTDHANLLGR